MSADDLAAQLRSRASEAAKAGDFERQRQEEVERRRQEEQRDQAREEILQMARDVLQMEFPDGAYEFDHHRLVIDDLVIGRAGGGRLNSNRGYLYLERPCRCCGSPAIVPFYSLDQFGVILRSEDKCPCCPICEEDRRCSRFDPESQYFR